MLPTGIRALFASGEAEERERYSKLASTLLDGNYHTGSPQRLLPASAASQMMSSHTLPVGWEQRVEPATKGGSRRLFYMDHFTRSTTLVDPRTSAATPVDVLIDDQEGDEPLSEFLLLCSGVLGEQHVGAADYRAALNRALRHSLAGLLPSERAPAGLRERRLQLQQHIQLACLERLFGRGVAPACTLVTAHNLFVEHHAPPASPPVDKHILDSLLKHANQADLMGLYTSGFFGPKRRHLWRVHNRLDMLPGAALRGLSLPGSGSVATAVQALSQAPEPLTTTLENALYAILFGSATKESRERLAAGLQPEAWWLAAQTSFALAETSASLTPLLFASRALLQPGVPSPPPPPAQGAPEGASASAAAAPGMGYRLAKMYRAVAVDHASMSLSLPAHWRPDLLSGGLERWRETLGLPRPPALEPAASASSARRLSKSDHLTRPELTPELTPPEAAAGFLALASGYASPMEGALLGLSYRESSHGFSAGQAAAVGNLPRAAVAAAAEAVTKDAPALRPLASLTTLAERLSMLTDNLDLHKVSPHRTPSPPSTLLPRRCPEDAPSTPLEHTLEHTRHPLGPDSPFGRTHGRRACRASRAMDLLPTHGSSPCSPHDIPTHGSSS